MVSTTFTVVDKFGIDRDVQFDEIPQSFSGISSISVTNAGAGYTSQPTITIDGDGTGATAEAIINTNGTLRSINVLTTGNNYTSAAVSITPAAGDTTGTGGSGVVILEGQYGTLRTYYNNNKQIKTINK